MVLLGSSLRNWFVVCFGHSSFCRVCRQLEGQKQGSEVRNVGKTGLPCPVCSLDAGDGFRPTRINLQCSAELEPQHEPSLLRSLSMWQAVEQGRLMLRSVATLVCS